MSAFSGAAAAEEEEEEEDDAVLHPAEADRLATQFTSWYPLLEDVTMKSRTVPLSDAFLEYLKEDGIVLPKSSEGVFGLDQLSDDSGDEEVVEVKEEGAGGGEEAAAVRDFPELDAQITAAMSELGGSVFPKLNWSCPLDAAWINAGSLKCQRLADVYMLLKASDRVLFDVECMLQGTGRDKNRPECVTLVLRKWANLSPSMEFRAFVRDNVVVGICQRDCTAFYDFLLRESEADDLAALVEAFCASRLAHRLPLSSFIADVYVDKARRVWVVDINVFGPPTSSLLFDWHELRPPAAAVACPPGGSGSGSDDCGQGCEFRVVESPSGVLPSEAAQSKGPIDVTLAPDFHRFMDLCKAQRGEDDGEEA